MTVKNGFDLTVSVTGVKEALRELKQIDERAYWAAIEEMKKAARETIVPAIDGNFPPEGPTGFQHNGRTGWKRQKPTEVQFGGKSSRTMSRTGNTPLLRVKIVDAPRQIFDMAGARDAGNKTDRGLQAAGYGTASRAVWRTSEQTRRAANAALITAMRKVMAQTNRRLNVIRGAA